MSTTTSPDLRIPLLANESDPEQTSTTNFECGWLSIKEERRGCCLRGLWTRRYCKFDKTGNGQLDIFEDEKVDSGKLHCFVVHNCAELPSRMCKRSGRFDLEVCDADGGGAECWRGFAATENVDEWVRAFVKYNASVQRPAAERSDRFRAIRKRKMDRGRHGVLRLAIVFIAGGFSLGVASAVKGTGAANMPSSGSETNDKCNGEGVPPFPELVWALVGMMGWILCSIALMTVSLVSGFDIDDFSEKHPRTFTSLSALMTLLSIALTTIDSGQHAHFYVDWIYGVPFCFFALFGLRSPNFRRHFTKVCKLALVLFLSTSRYTAAGFYHDPRPTRWLGLTVATCFVLASLFLCSFWFRGAHTIDGSRSAPSLLLWRMVYIACFLYTSIQILSLVAELCAGICNFNFREAVALFGYVCVLTTSAAMIFRRERMLQWMERTFEGKQRLADGAFIAALLDSEAVVPKVGQSWWIHLSDDNTDARLHKDLSFRRREREHNWRDGVVVQVKSDGVVVRMHSRARDDECVHGFVPPYGGGSTVTSVPHDLAGSHEISPTSKFATTEAVPKSHGRSGSYDTTQMDKRSSLQRATSAAVITPRERKRQLRQLARSTSAAVISIDSEVYPPQTSSSTTNAERGWLHTIKYDTSMTASESLAQMQDPKVLMQQATKEMRCIDWSKMDRQLFVSSPRAETSKNPNALYELSRPVAEHDKIDFFISHSWSDQGHAKFKALSAIASAFRKERGREPTFWFDKVCFNQKEISNSLKVLPINVMRCNKVLALCGRTYAKRLWCAWELYILFAYRPDEQAVHDVQLVPLDDENLKCCKPGCSKKDTANVILCASCEDARYHADCMPDPSTDIRGDWLCAECNNLAQQKSGLLRQFSSPKQSRRSSSCAGDTHIRELMHFDLSDARCYDPNEEAKIRKIIGGGGGRNTFQNHIRSLAKKVWSHRNAAPVPPPQTGVGGHAANC